MTNSSVAMISGKYVLKGHEDVSTLLRYPLLSGLSCLQSEVQIVFLTYISDSKDQYSCFHWAQIAIEMTKLLGLPVCLF